MNSLSPTSRPHPRACSLPRPGGGNWGCLGKLPLCSGPGLKDSDSPRGFFSLKKPPWNGCPGRCLQEPSRGCQRMGSGRSRWIREPGGSQIEMLQKCRGARRGRERGDGYLGRGVSREWDWWILLCWQRGGHPDPRDAGNGRGSCCLEFSLGFAALTARASVSAGEVQPLDSGAGGGIADRSHNGIWGHHSCLSEGLIQGLPSSRERPHLVHTEFLEQRQGLALPLPLTWGAEGKYSAGKRDQIRAAPRAAHGIPPGAAGATGSLLIPCALGAKLPAGSHFKEHPCAFMVPHTQSSTEPLPGAAEGCSCLGKAIPRLPIRVLWKGTSPDREFIPPTPNARDLLPFPPSPPPPAGQGKSTEVFCRFLALCEFPSCLAAFFSPKVCGVCFFPVFPSSSADCSSQAFL